MALYSTLMEEITWYTGLSPTAFFTILAMMVVVYRTVCGMFVSPEDFNKPPIITAPNNIAFENSNPEHKPVQLGEITEQELRAYNGSDPNKPLLISVKGQIYDVSSGRYSKFIFFFFPFVIRALIIFHFWVFGELESEGIMRS